MIKTRVKLLSSAIAIALATSPAWGQGAAGTDAQGGDAGQSGKPVALEEMIVTATKREQGINNVGMSISALDTKALQDQHIGTVADLAKVTPGLTFAPTPNATPVYTMRGVGFYEPTLSAYPDVSLYLDQVPLALPTMSALTAFDLERVEVLKGPQGTLFGNNATGGAINFIPNKPSNDFEAGGELGYGSFNTKEASGYVSGPLTDTLTARAAVKTTHADGWQRSYTRHDTLGKRNELAGRIIVDWNPTDVFRASLDLNGWLDKSEPQAPQYYVARPQYAVGTTSPFTGQTIPANYPIIVFPAAPHSARAADWDTNHRPYQDSKFQQSTLRMEYDINDDATLVSLTGYGDLYFENATESDGTPLATLDIDPQIGHIHSFTQELRIDGSTDRTRYTAGLNYEHTSVSEREDLYIGDTTTYLINGFTGNSWGSDQVMKNYAGFANLEYDLTDEFTVKGGIRQTRAERDAIMYGPHEANGQYPVGLFGPNSMTTFFNAVYGAIGPMFGGTIAPIAVGNSITLDTRLNPDGTPVDPSTYLKTGNPTGQLNENNTSWSLGLDYKPSPDLLVYANVGKGYKAGSFPTLAGAIYSAYAPVTQESLVAYETGFKATMWDQRLSLNTALFYYDYSDKQLRTKFVDPIFGALDHLVNVPKSKVQGVEVDASAAVTDGLKLSASVTYLDAKVTKYDGVVGETVVGGLRQPITASFNGVHLPFAPQWQYAFRADYHFPLTGNLDGFVGAGVNGQSESEGTLAKTAQDRKDFTVNSRALVDANLGVATVDGKWRVSLWGKNIFNRYYWTQAVQAYDNVVRYAGRPAEYGVSLSYKY